MWRNPNYPSPAPIAPAEDKGRRLATIPRRGRDEALEELRISLEEYQGHPYLSVRLWTKGGGSGEFFPTRKGCSIRISEAEQVSAALLEGHALAVAGSVPTSTPCPAEDRRMQAAGRRSRGVPDQLPDPRSGVEGFSEF